MFRFDFRDILITLPGILMAISFHEFAHAYVAHKLGDDTAKDAGRLSISPISHIDLVGMLMLLFAGFGWAKPVPVDERNFSNRKSGIFFVSIAGIVMNLILATCFMFTISIFQNMNPVLREIFISAFFINIVFASFNLLPIPPLDGSRLLGLLLGDKMQYKFYQFQYYSFAIMIILIMTDAISYILNPMISFFSNIIISIVGLFF